MCEPDEIEDFESGPFCRHWGDGDCDEVCTRCGHKCGRHWYGECAEDGCDCPGWVESPNDDNEPPFAMDVKP